MNRMHFADVTKHSKTTQPEDVPGIIRPYGDYGLIKYCQCLVGASVEQDEIAFGKWGILTMTETFGAYAGPYIVGNVLAGLLVANRVGGICMATDDCPEGYWAYFMLKGWFTDAVAVNAAYTVGQRLQVVDNSTNGNGLGDISSATADFWVATSYEAATTTALNVYVSVPNPL